MLSCLPACLSCLPTRSRACLLPPPSEFAFSLTDLLFCPACLIISPFSSPAATHKKALPEELLFSPQGLTHCMPLQHFLRPCLAYPFSAGGTSLPLLHCCNQAQLANPVGQSVALANGTRPWWRFIHSTCKGILGVILIAPSSAEFWKPCRGSLGHKSAWSGDAITWTGRGKRKKSVNFLSHAYLGN